MNVAAEQDVKHETVELAGALQALAGLNPAEGKGAMINRVDGAVARVLTLLESGDANFLQQPAQLKQIKFVLEFLEKCKAFRDAEFTLMVRERVEQIQHGLQDLPAREKRDAEAVKEAAKQEALRKKAEKAAAEKAEIAKARAEYEAEQAAKEEAKAKAKAEFEHFTAESICIQNLVRFYDGKLDVLRSTKMYGRHSIIDFGIGALFPYSIEFSVLIEDAIKGVIKDNRSLLTRQVYASTSPEADEETIRSQLRTPALQRALVDAVINGFNKWEGEIKEAVKRRAEEARGGKKKSAGKKKSGGGLFSKLMKKEEKAAPAKKADKGPAKPLPSEEMFDKWMAMNSGSEIYFPETFTFGMLGQIARLEERHFESEVERVTAIAKQAGEGKGAKGAVGRALNQTMKSVDQFMFELLLLNFLYTKNNMSLMDVQDAGMGLKLDEGRLPLVVPELGRRPMAYAKRLEDILSKKQEPRLLKNALDFYFEAILVLHLQIFEDQRKTSSAHLNEFKETLPKGLQEIVDAIVDLVERVTINRQQARETGEDTTRNTKDTIDHSIGKIMNVYTKMYEKSAG